MAGGQPAPTAVTKQGRFVIAAPGAFPMSVINTNVAANNAFLNLSRTSGMMEKSIQKLSSGFRINRSADDAAGASIANSLRATGRSLAAAPRDATQAKAGPQNAGR